MAEAAWEEGFSHLKDFVEREGHCLAPQTYRDEDGFRLGYWVRTQRAYQGRGQLSEERRQRLEALLGWVWDTREATWEEGFARLRSFQEREGHTRVPGRYRDDDGFHLGHWVNNQRSRRAQYSKERLRRLEAVPGWVWDAREVAWEEAYARLRLFAEREGHSRVPKDYQDEDGFSLGAWTARQRQHRGRLPAERRQQFEALPGWSLGRERGRLGRGPRSTALVRGARGPQSGPGCLPRWRRVQAGRVGEASADESRPGPTLGGATAAAGSCAGLGLEGTVRRGLHQGGGECARPATGRGDTGSPR